MDDDYGVNGDGRRVARREASIRQRLNYLESGLATELGLREAVRRLGLCGVNLDESRQRVRLEMRIRRLETATDDVHDDLISYLASDVGFRSINSAESELIRARAHQLLGLPSDAVPYEILEIANELIEAWGISVSDEERQETDGESEDVPLGAPEEASAVPPAEEGRLGLTA